MSTRRGRTTASASLSTQGHTGKCTVCKTTEHTSNLVPKRYNSTVYTLSVCYLSLLITIEVSPPSPSSQILLKSFSSEEVGTWSALKSPRVVELFGVIREGPYVVLFMDLKAGELYTILYLDLRQ